MPIVVALARTLLLGRSLASGVYSWTIVGVGALALADRELHVVQVSASERLGTTRAADGGVNEEVRQMCTLVQ